MQRLYKGLYPLWGRQIPYTMVKFATFEKTVEYIYKTLGKPKESYNKFQQTGISFLGGYIAGIGSAIVSHPADVMVSKLNSDRKPGESAGKALSRIYGNIGFMGLWNGLPVRIVMIGTLTGAQWLIYDSFKVFLGVRDIALWAVTASLLTTSTVADHWWSLERCLLIHVESGVSKSGYGVQCTNRIGLWFALTLFVRSKMLIICTALLFLQLLYTPVRLQHLEAMTS